MDLKNAEAVMRPAEGKNFDPTKIPKAVKDAGFTPGEVEITAVGILSRQDELLILEIPGSVRQFILAGGQKVIELQQRHDLLAQRLRISGKLHPSHADKPPGLTVERWVLMRQPD